MSISVHMYTFMLVTHNDFCDSSWLFFLMFLFGFKMFLWGI